MHPIAAPLALFTSIAVGLPAQEAATAEEPFPASTALAEGVSPEALARLDQLVQGFVDNEEIVGAELLVIVNGRSILREAYGWRDLEARLPMETGSVFCVRSMTKPVVGAAILMLVDDRVIKLSDRVSEHLPAFDVEGSREITVEHLLTHTSGLPMSLILGKDLEGLDGIAAVAELGGSYQLDFEPGSSFEYSDQGTDTLTALIEVTSGMPAAEFVRTRVLEPLGMHRSTCVMTEDHPLRARAIDGYAGSRGAWTRFWSPDDPPLFPFFLGSQGLYSTLEDYALFSEFWLRKGRARTGRLLGSRYVRKALTLGPHPMGYPTGLPGLSAEYGFLMQLWSGPGEEGADGEDGEAEVVAFGHTGSDGTHAWVFPEQKAMVMYFTQSRNNTTGLRVEEVLGELFLGAPFDPNQVAPPFEEYMGYYWEGENDLYRAIVRDGEDLALEILGKGVVPLTYAGEDSWKFRPNPSTVLAFDRSADGIVTGYHIGDHQEFRFQPSAELPSVADLQARVAQAHRLDLLESIGPLRMRGELEMEQLGITGTWTSLLEWPGRYRVDSFAMDQFEQLAFDGEQVRYRSTAKQLELVDGRRGDLLRRDNPFARLGEWSRWHPAMVVIQRLQRGGESAFVVRAGGLSAPAPTLYIDAESGLVGRVDSLIHIDTMGRIGQRVRFDEFSDVSGMTLPFRTETELANPLIGKIVTHVTEFELGVDLAEGTFALAD